MCVWIDGGLKLSHTLFLELHFCSKWQNDLLFSLIWTLGKVVTCFQAGCVPVRRGVCGICSSPREDFLCCLPFDHHFSSTLRPWWPSTTCHMQMLWLKVGSDGEVPENPGQTQFFIYLFLFFCPLLSSFLSFWFLKADLMLYHFRLTQLNKIPLQIPDDPPLFHINAENLFLFCLWSRGFPPPHLPPEIVQEMLNGVLNGFQCFLLTF